MASTSFCTFWRLALASAVSSAALGADRNIAASEAKLAMVVVAATALAMGTAVQAAAAGAHVPTAMDAFNSRSG